MLTYHPSIYSLILILVSVSIALFALTRWRLRTMRPTAGPGALLMWCGSLWILANALEIASANLQTAQFWFMIENVAMAPVPVLWLAMSLQFTGYYHLLTRKHWLILGIAPLISLLALATNDAHGLYVSNEHFEVQGSITNLVTKPGLVMVSLYLYGYVLTILGAYLLTRKLLYSRGFRWQGIWILMGVALTVVANILDWSQLNPFPYIKLTPLALVIAIPLWVFTIIRTRRADIIPIARNNIIQIMQDAVLVLDVENRIIDTNPAAEKLIGLPLKDIFGKPINEAWPDSVGRIDALSGDLGDRNELRVGEANQARIFDVRRSSLTDWRGQRLSQVIVLRDVTKRVQAEDSLRLSEEHFRALTENATDLVGIVDGNGIIGYASPSIERGFGYKISDLIGKSVIEFIHPDDTSLVLTTLKTSIEQPGIAPSAITRFRHLDGGWRTVEYVANNLLQQPAVRGIVINARDITDRTETEEKLRLSESYFRALTENSTDVTIITDLGGTIQYVSPSLERIFQRTRDEAVGKNTLDFIHPDDVNRLLTSMTDSMVDPQASKAITARFHDSSGCWHILECVASNMLDHPAIKGIVVNARDVTERETIAEALRQSEERYRLHFAHVNDVIYSYDLQLRLLSMSPSLERQLGFKPETFIGKSILELGVLPTEYFEKASIEAMRVLAGERIEGAKYELIAADGTRKIAEISSSPIFQSGEVIAVVNVARDITERVRANELLRTSLTEKEVLLREIHHRVKNNLQIIASLLNLQSNSIDDPLTLAQFQDSQNRVRSMALIHERLYRSDNLAQIDFGTYLRDLASSLVQTYRGQAQSIQLKVEFDTILLDIDRAIPCGLLVNELVSNALKHAFPNERSGMIGVEMRSVGESCYQLAVWDDGIGFPADVDFQKTASLGLQLVNSLTHQISGALELDTHLGTRFNIVFSKLG